MGFLSVSSAGNDALLHPALLCASLTFADLLLGIRAHHVEGVTVYFL
jgi:hypothetical protein